MRIRVNGHCNVCTGEHSTDRHSRPQITMPGYRLRMSITEAKMTADALLAAIAVAEVEAAKRQEGGDGPVKVD